MIKEALVTLVLDRSGSMSACNLAVDECIQRIVRDCQEIDSNLLLRITSYNEKIKEEHDFKRVVDCQVKDYENFLKPGGQDALKDATVEAIEKSVQYAANYPDVKFNATIFVISDGGDNSSRTLPSVLEDLINKTKEESVLNSLTTTLIGINIHDSYTGADLQHIKKAFDGYVGFQDADEKSLTKLSRFISRSIAATARVTHDEFSKAGRKKTTMAANGFTCVLHMPAVINSEKTLTEDKLENLPPFAPRPAFDVDEYKDCPPNWMHGSSVASSYFVPVLSNHGLWLDFENNRDNEHDVAVVVSVQGINPLTGEKSTPIALEQYKTMCPRHQREFLKDRFCEECNYKWNAQNYLSSTAPEQMWLDGFRTRDGVVRQWFFTEEEYKGIAQNLIGEDRVFAIGVAFYKSKNKKAPVNNYRGYHPGVMSMMSFGAPVPGKPIGWAGAQGIHALTALPARGDVTEISNCVSDTASISYTSCSERGIYALSALPERDTYKDFIVETANLEISAGAEINQEIGIDPNSPDYWEASAAGFIYINYCNAVTARKIIDGGKRIENREGFLSRTPNFS